MPFEKVKDPFSGKQVEIFEGYVSFVKIAKLDKPDHLGNTYRVGVCVDGEDGNGTWLSWGSYKDEKMFRDNNTSVNAKTDDGYVTVRKGCKIRVPVSRNGDFINPVRKNLVMLEQAEAYVPNDGNNAPTGGKSQGSGGKKDNSGMETGHAARAAAVVSSTLGLDYKFCVRKIHDATRKLVEWYTDNNPHKMNAYNAGMAAGCAVNCVCDGLTEPEDIKDLYEKSKSFLQNEMEYTRSYIKGEIDEDSSSEKVDNTDQNNDNDDGGEDDIPF